MPTVKNANYNGRLTTYAAGLAQSPKENSLADFIFPRVGTGVSHGQYKRYSGKNAMQIVETMRAIGGPASRIKFETDDPFYNAKPHALETTIDDAERDAAGDVSGAMQALEEAKVGSVITTARLSREVAIQKIIDSLTPVAGLGAWSDADVDPIKELDEELAAMTTRTGIMPNRIAIGLSAWIKLRHHPKVLARQPGSANQGVNLTQLAAMLAIPNLEIRLGTLSRDKNKFGKAKDAEQIFGAKVLLFIGSENPTTYDPSFGKTFGTNRSSVDSVYSYRDQPCRSDVYAVDWSEDPQVVFSEAASLITLS